MVMEHDFAVKGQSGGDRDTLRWVDNFPVHFLTPFVIHSFIQEVFTTWILGPLFCFVLFFSRKTSRLLFAINLHFMGVLNIGLTFGRY